MAWVSIDDLRTNLKFIESVQNATLNRPGFGLDPVPALFGTSSWWDAIEDGRIPSATSEKCRGGGPLGQQLNVLQGGRSSRSFR